MLVRPSSGDGVDVAGVGSLGGDAERSAEEDGDGGDRMCGGGERECERERDRQPKRDCRFEPLGCPFALSLSFFLLRAAPCACCGLLPA